jgi:hypothetical protein
MDPVAIGAVLLVIISGAGTQLDITFGAPPPSPPVSPS